MFCYSLPDLILRILERVQKTPSPNLPQLFVQLSPLVDVVSAIASKSPDKVELIVERQAPVFDSPAKTKDILHTLTENLKSELVRYMSFTIIITYLLLNLSWLPRPCCQTDSGLVFLV